MKDLKFGKSTILAVVGAGLVLFAGVAFAKTSFWDAAAVAFGEALASRMDVPSADDMSLGASGTRFPNGVSADGTSPSAGEVRGTTLTTTGAASVAGAFQASSTLEVTGAGIFYGDLNGQKSASTTDGVASTVADHQSNHVIFIKGTGATVTLPAASEGVSVRAVVAAAFATNAVIASAEGDNIDGTLIVNDAPVACAGEDQINLVASAESVSDWVELTVADLNGTATWIITGSNGDLTGSITCTDPS